MGMTKCKECKKELSTQAFSCPHCGARMPLFGKNGKATNAHLLVALVVGGAIDWAFIPEFATGLSPSWSAYIFDFGLSLLVVMIIVVIAVLMFPGKQADA